jgi:pimeloyl-ACP methyl ester carboxylesterase
MYRSDSPITVDDLKVAQLAFREAEVEETIRVLRVIHDGDGAQVRKENPRGEGVSFADWEGRLDVESVTIAGHSYGATLAVSASTLASAHSQASNILPRSSKPFATPPQKAYLSVPQSSSTRKSPISPLLFQTHHLPLQREAKRSSKLLYQRSNSNNELRLLDREPSRLLWMAAFRRRQGRGSERNSSRLACVVSHFA